MKKTALMIMIITIVSKVLGFARELTLSYFFGATAVSDAYLISLTIPNVIFSFIAVAFGASFIPTFSKIESQQGLQKANLFTSNILNIILALSVVMVVVGLFFTEPLIQLFASGFEGEVFDLATFFTRVSIIAIIFKAFTLVFTNYLHVRGSFNAPAMIGFPMNIILIASIALSAGNQNWLPIGVILSAASQLLLLLPSLKSKGFSYKPVFDLKDPQAKAMLLLSLPVMLGTSVNDINVLVDRTIASSITSGGISALNYAQRLNGFIMGIFVLSIITVAYPKMSKMVADDNLTGMKKVLGEIISILSLIIFPAMVGSIIFSEEIVSFLFGRGAFDLEATRLTSIALFFYSMGMFSFGIRELLSRSFYTLGDTKTPMINGVMGVLLNIVLNIVLSRLMGLGGLALATSLAGTFTSLILLIGLRKKMGPIGFKSILESMVKVGLASLLMGLISRLAFQYLITLFSQNLSLLLSIGLGVLVYLILIILLRVKETTVMIALFKSRFSSVK